MKYQSAFTIGVLLLLCGTITFGGPVPVTLAVDNTDPVSGDTLRIMSSPELMPLVNTWAGKFSSQNPAVKISVSNCNGVINAGQKSLCIIPELKNVAGSAGQSWKIIIGHNAVVPVINAAHPNLNELLARGITASEFAALFSANGKTRWSDLIKKGKNEAVNIYIAEGEDIKEYISKFAGSYSEDVSGIVTASSGEIGSLVEKDVNSIGFCKLADIRSSVGNTFSGNYVLLPIDRNANGRIDSFEKIYASPDEFTRGIWLGKYPSSLCGSIFATCSEKPSAIDQIAFLKWILTDGSDYMGSNGFISLASIEREAGLTALAGQPLNNVSDIGSKGSYAYILILAAIVILSAVTVYAVKKSGKAGIIEPVRISKAPSAFNESAISSPKGILFDKSHTWAFMERDGLVRLGVDDFMQHVTGILTGIRMREPGEYVTRGEKILSIIKDGKQIDLYSPVSGTIKSLNTDLNIDASVVNSSPYSDGWIYLIEPKNWAREMQLMFMADKYRQWLSDEFRRLKDFLSTVSSENSAFALAIMQDGGEIKPYVLADLEPEAWDDFQTRFIDVSR